jgi:hypothetical protein
MEREAEGPLRLRATAMIIRIWPEAGTAPALRGEIEHLRTGEKRPFARYEALVALLEQWRQDDLADGLVATQEGD